MRARESSDSVLRTAKQRAQRVYYEDGLFEIIAGLCLLIGAASRWTPYIGWMAPFLVGVALPAIKKRLAGPRVGYVDLGGAFKGDRRKQTILGVTIVAVLLLALLGGFWLTERGRLGSPSQIGKGAGVFMGLVCAALFLGLGIPRRVPHFIAYGTVFLAASIAVPFISQPLQYVWGSLILMGSVIGLVGMVRLMRFLRKYPLTKPSEDDADEPLHHG